MAWVGWLSGWGGVGVAGPPPPSGPQATGPLFGSYLILKHGASRPGARREAVGAKPSARKRVIVLSNAPVGAKPVFRVWFGPGLGLTLRLIDDHTTACAVPGAVTCVLTGAAERTRRRGSGRRESGRREAVRREAGRREAGGSNNLCLRETMTVFCTQPHNQDRVAFSSARPT